MLWTTMFLALLFVLWASSACVFVRASLSPRRKVVWTLLLLSVGVAIGLLLPLGAIKTRFLFLVLLLPVLALIDIKLARSNRSFVFWLRACSFEISTVFLAATITRGAVEAW